MEKKPLRKVGSKKNSVQVYGSLMPSNHSPLAFQARKSLSKKVLSRNSPTVSATKLKLAKSPSMQSPIGASSRRSALKNSRTNHATLSHRANLNISMARNSNRGIVTMSSPHGLKSGTLRVRSGRRGSAMSHRSADSASKPTLVQYQIYNEACNQFYDKNMGKAFDRFK